MRGIHCLLATLIALTMIPLAEAQGDPTIRLSRLCHGTPENGPDFDELDAIVPRSLQRAYENLENPNFYCANTLYDIVIPLP